MTFRRPPKLKTADDFISGAGTPVQLGNLPDQEAAAGHDFIRLPEKASAEEPGAAASREAARPWEGKRNHKQTEVFNLRLTEVELEKLRFIAANTPDSMQAFVRKVLLPAIDTKLSDLV